MSLSMGARPKLTAWHQETVLDMQKLHLMTMNTLHGHDGNNVFCLRFSHIVRSYRSCNSAASNFPTLFLREKCSTPPWQRERKTEVLATTRTQTVDCQMTKKKYLAVSLWYLFHHLPIDPNFTQNWPSFLTIISLQDAFLSLLACWDNHVFNSDTFN